MKFFDAEKDEREDWRRHPLTIAALDELRKMRAQMEQDALSDVRLGLDDAARLLTGKADGIGEAIELLTKEEDK